MDPSVKKLLAELKRAEDERFRASLRIKHIQAALAILGVRPDSTGATAGFYDRQEAKYIASQPFAGLTLAETCERILRDNGGQLSRAQVEFLAARGGYDFSTTNPSNSVDVTLRRMAANGKIEAERVRGSRGSRYRWIPKPSDVSEEGKA